MPGAEGGHWDVAKVLPLPLANWLEAVFFGIYTTLFLQYMISRYRHGTGKTLAGRVYFVVTILMYLVGVACSAGLSIYGATRSPYTDYVNGKAAKLVADVSSLLAFVQMWMGDFLIALRTHLLWDYNFRITAIPWALLAGTLFIIVFTATGVSQDIRQVSAALTMVLAQNVITTGLLIYRLLSQHSESARAGLHRYSRRSGSLIRIASIISQSAGLYLTVLFLYNLFFFLRHPGMVYMQVMIPSVTGIALLAISVRVAGMKTGGTVDSSFTWTPPTDWRTSVHFARSHVDVGTTSEDGVQEEAERYIEARYPDIFIKEEGRRASPPLPQLHSTGPAADVP
ncbi:hypothetical protein EV715DRAFT_210873 [Schizophyllum commune]